MGPGGDAVRTGSGPCQGSRHPGRGDAQPAPMATAISRLGILGHDTAGTGPARVAPPQRWSSTALKRSRSPRNSLAPRAIRSDTQRGVAGRHSAPKVMRGQVAAAGSASCQAPGATGVAPGALPRLQVRDAFAVDRSRGHFRHGDARRLALFPVGCPYRPRHRSRRNLPCRLFTPETCPRAAAAATPGRRPGARLLRP